MRYDAVVLVALLTLLKPEYTSAASSNQPPRFVGFASALFIPEGTKAGTVITTLRAIDPENDVLTFGILGEIAKNKLRIQRVNNTAANVRLIAELDREQVDQYSVLFEVKDRVNTIQRYTTLLVTDINDNAPSFINLPYRADIPENAPPGTYVLKVSATDPDSGIWGLVNYNITPNKKIQQDLFVINTVQGNVTLQGKLDYEKEKFYQLEIMAIDGTGLNSSTDLIINVQDVQDTPPFFENLPYIAAVYENATIGTPILRVSALDGDRGVPNPVTYSFLSGNHKYFHINESTGVISVGKPMDREEAWVRDLYGVLDLKVQTKEVTSRPKGPTTAVAPVTITILDVNDQAPTFSRSFYNASVLENSQASIPITLYPRGTNIIVRDLDQGNNGRFELLLESNGQPFTTFDLVPTRVLNEANVLIRVKNTSALDYEKRKTFTFQVVARELNTVARARSSAVVQVNIEDANDNWPTFPWEVYNVSVYENSPKDTYITQIQASDKDSGTYGDLTYSIRGASAGLFRIDSKSGKVYVKVAADRDTTLLDREKVDTHYLTLEASDGGGLHTSVQLQIKVLDRNDNAPRIARSQYEGYVNENAPTLQRPLVIEATDRDLGVNRVISYHITSGNQQRNFSINPSTGRVQLTGPLDYEAMAPNLKGKFNLIVMARNIGSPSLDATVPVTINVEDVNDEIPYFTQSVYYARVPENSTGGTLLTTVTARDHDGTAPNNEVIYRIESGARDKFRIDAISGRITVESGANLDRDLYGKVYTLKVLAIDRGTPPNTGATLVNITVNDVNNKHPVFQPDRQQIRISEATKVGKIVFTYTAVDADYNSLLRYNLLEDQVAGEDENKRPSTDKAYLNSLFGIYRQNGSIYVKSRLDRERIEEVTLTVFVEDLNAMQPPVQNTTAKLTVVLSDVNDYPPTFVPSNVYHARISEASQEGIEVKQVLARDRDKGGSTISYYVIYDSEESKAFEITPLNRNRGVITLKRKVNHERQRSVNVTVTAVDAGVPPLRSSAQVLVEIEDVNDESPVWQIFNKKVTIAENATVGTIVTQVHAVDKDSGAFGTVSYTITNGAEGKFLIDNQTGIIRVSGGLDRETKANYELTVEAGDNIRGAANERRTTTSPMEITLLDINDFVPQFEKASYVADNVQESSKENAQVLTVRAYDLDQGLNAKIKYSLNDAATNASGLFSVDQNGEVMVKRSLQGHTGWFYVTVVATDMGNPPLSNSVHVYINVDDVNDHRPEIYQPPENFTVYVMENQAKGAWVTKVEARDLDSGTNGQVRYAFVESEANRQQDWKKFRIHPVGGNITTAVSLDREDQEVYVLEVKAYDLGKIRYEDRRTIKVVAVDRDDNNPEFPVGISPYKVSALEERNNTFVANLSLAKDPDSGNNSRICYYIVGGDEYKDRFYLNKATGLLWLKQKIDREQMPAVQLVVKATKDCWTSNWERPEHRNHKFNSSDSTQMLVTVSIKDINDNSPRFLKQWFTAGVTRDTQVNERVINFLDYTVDPDMGNNSVRQFYIVKPFVITKDLERQLRERKEMEPFKLGALDGMLRTNIFFQQNMQGYFKFKVQVRDYNDKHVSKADVSIYLLNENQRVKAVIRGSISEIGTFKDLFAEFLSNITGAIINVDKIQTHKDAYGKPDDKLTDMFLHAIDPKTGQVLEAKKVIDMMDRNYGHLVELLKKYNVIEIVKAVDTAPVTHTERDLQLALILTAVPLGILIIILLIAFCVYRSTYRRKLKAATAMAFGSRDNGMNHIEMPGTNMHTFEGSNPIWMEQYENGWPREEDADSKNSLDDNALEPTSKMYDEQEMSMDLYNDEYDHYNRMPPSKMASSDIYLTAALNEREAAKQNHHTSNNLNQNHQNHVNSKHRKPHLKLANSYSNHGYEHDSVETRNINGLQTTEI